MIIKRTKMCIIMYVYISLLHLTSYEKDYDFIVFERRNSNDFIYLTLPHSNILCRCFVYMPSYSITKDYPGSFTLFKDNNLHAL